MLCLILRDARINGLIDSSPFDTRPKRDTKVTRASRNRRRVRFRPFLADELGRLLAVLRVPRDRTEALYFPLTEFMLLTGLRWGECVGVLWSDVSWTGGEIHIQRAVVRGEDRTDEPTTTGEDWNIPLRPPVAELLQVQQERSFVGRTEGRIFPGPSGGPISYTSWLRRGWRRALTRAKVEPREGDAQKAARRSYITSGLICGRNSKLISGEVGHTTVRMITEVYDSFIDPARWPDEDECHAVAGLYGWSVNSEDGVELWSAPHVHPRAPERNLT